MASSQVAKYNVDFLQLNHSPQLQAHRPFIMYPELLTSERFTLSLRKSDIIKAQIRPSETAKCNMNIDLVGLRLNLQPSKCAY